MLLHPVGAAGKRGSHQVSGQLLDANEVLVASKKTKVLTNMHEINASLPQPEAGVSMKVNLNSQIKGQRQGKHGRQGSKKGVAGDRPQDSLPDQVGAGDADGTETS